jgi:hypothetical protein
MLIPNELLYLGYPKEWKEVITNNKVHLQTAIFTYGLTFVLLTINLLEIITTREDRFLLRMAKSILTILLTYLTAALTFKLMDVKTLNLFYYYRGTPANIMVFVTMLFTTLGMFLLEGAKTLYLIRFDKSAFDESVPTWLKLEN